MMSKVNNLKEFLEARGCGEKDFSDVEKATYKYTTCGAWITHTDISIRFGSIIEGCDQVTDVTVLFYPFEIEKFWEELDKIDKQAEKIWNDTHGCEDCHTETQVDEWGNERFISYVDQNEFGNWSINPECKTCEGEGVIL